jgi:hypothetical protein
MIGRARSLLLIEQDRKQARRMDAVSASARRPTSSVRQLVVDSLESLPR